MKIHNSYQVNTNKNSQIYFIESQTQNRFGNSVKIAINRLGHDTISFKSSSPVMKLEKATHKILERSIVFGPTEYKNLSMEDLSKLRKYEKYFVEKDKITIKFILKFGKYFSEQMNKKYPNGFTLVSLGRSPAFLAKYLEFQGVDVKYCPASNLYGKSYKTKDFSPYFIKVYKKFLESIGLTKEAVLSAQKPIIITDYNCHGCSLQNFKTILENPQIGIYESQKVKFSPITLCEMFKRENAIFNHDPYYDYLGKTEGWKFSDLSYLYNMENEKPKTYTSIPYLDVLGFGEPQEEILNLYYRNGNKFEENFETKMMNFIIADEIQNAESIQNTGFLNGLRKRFSEFLSKIKI